LATIKNIIQTQFTSTGAGGVNKQVETLNKGQTRLAQNSASAGRSFAAQSQGLGGLVAAYAGAAATTFALQQAFSKLAAAASAEQTLAGLKSIATASGESSSILLKNVREITKNQLTLAEAAQQINLSLSAGFDQKQIEGLASVALKASRALGRDLTDAYTRVIRGSAKLETELLDELGIYTKIGPSTRAYAAALNRSAESLTEFERRQAFVNSVIAEGNRKFAAINTTIPTTAEKFGAFGTKVLDLATSFGMVLANRLVPLVDFLTNNFAGSLTLVAGLLALVAKTGLSQVSLGITALEQKFTSLTNASTAWVTKNIGGFKAYGAAAQQAIQTVNTQLKGLSRAEQAQLATLRDTSKQRALTSVELRTANLILTERTDGLNKLIATQNTELANLTKQRAGYAESSAQAKALTTSIDGLNARLAANNALLKATEVQTKATAAAQGTLGAKIGTVVSGALTGVGNFVSTTLRAGSAVIGFATGALGLISVLSLLGSTVASLFGKQEAYNALLEKGTLAISTFFNAGASKSTETAFSSLAADALVGMEKVDSRIREIDSYKIKDKAFGVTVDIERTKEDLVKSVGAAIDEASKVGQEASVGESWGRSWGSAILGAIGAVIGGAIGTALGPVGSAAGLYLGTAMGTAIGASFGAMFDPLTKEVQDLTEERYNEIAKLVGKEDIFKSSESNVLLRKSVALLDEQYGAAAKLSLAGRQYYIDVINTTIAVSSLTDNMEILAAAAGRSGIAVSALKENFKDITLPSGDVQLVPKIILPNSLDLPPLTITIQDETALIARLEELEKLATGITFADPDQAQDILSLVNGVADLATTTQSASQDILVANNNLKSFIDSIDSGSVTLENFAESEASISKTLTRSGVALDSARTKLYALTMQRKNAANDGTEISNVILQDLDKEIAAQKNIVAELANSTAASRERLAAVIASGSELKEQLVIGARLSELYEAELKTKLELLAVNRQTGALAATTYEKDLAKAQELNRIITEGQNSGKAALAARASYEKQVNDALIAAGKDQLGIQTEVFGLVGETGKARLAEIDAANGLNGTLSSINTITATTAESAANYDNALKAAKVSAIQVYEALRQGATEFEKQIKNIDQQIKNITAEERIVKLKVEFERAQMDYELIQANIDSQISALESQISIVEALTDLDNFATVDSIINEVNTALASTKITVDIPEELRNLSAVDAAKTVTEKQFDILKLQIEAENSRYKRELALIAEEEAILRAQYELEKSKRQAEQAAAIAEVELQRNQLTSLASLYSSSLQGTKDINQSLVDSLASIFSQAADKIAAAMGVAGTGAITAPTVGGDIDIEANLKGATIAFEDMATGAIDKINELAAVQESAASTALYNALQNQDKEVEAQRAAHASNIEGIKAEAIVTAAAGRGALKEIAEAGSKDAAERAKALEEMQKLLNEAGEKVKELAKQLAEQVIAALQEAVTGVMQKKIDLLIAQEAMISDTLSYVASRTEEASTKLQASLEKENSLREEVASKTEALNQSYVDFVTSLGEANGKVKESGKEYVAKLLEQKRSIMELYKTGTARIAQEGVVKTLEEMKIDLEKRLEEVTAKRIKAEEKLQKIQEAFGLLTDMLSGKFMQMANTIMQLSQAISAFNAMSGMGGGMGMTFQPIINQFADSVAQFNKAAQTAGAGLTGAAGAGAGSAAAAGVGATASLMPKLVTGMNLLSSALSGFNIGSIVGQLTGDTGMGSSIGGLVGGIAVAIPAVTSAITTGITAALGSSAIGSALGSALSFAIPVLGPVFGALLGGLFSSKPRGQAQGTLTSEGFATTSMSGKKVDPKALASIADVALTNVVGSLEAAGISFTDTVNTSISFYKKGINGATLEFANGFKASFKGGSAEAAGQFFVDSFFQGLRAGSLNVDDALPAASRIQSAIDNFVALSDVSEKTSERFSKAIDFASKFDEALVSLSGSGSTITQVFSVIEKAAVANAANVNRYYQEFLANTKETFGASSSEYREAYAAAVDNALGQIGLAKDLGGNIITAAEAMNDLNAGSIMVKETIAGIQAFSSVLEGLEVPDVDSVITQAINAKLSALVTDVGDSLTESIELLRDPASAAAFQLRDIMQSGADRVTELTGVYDQLRTEIAGGASIDASIVSDAAANIAKATELAALQVDAYINSLDKSGLRAIISNQAWGDAAAMAAAETRLAIVLEYERVQAIEKFVDVSKNFKKRLAEITGQVQKVSETPISYTATTSVMKAFEQEVSTTLTNSFTSLLNSIGRGANITGNFETAIAELNAGLASGELDSLAYANGLEMLSDVTASVLEEINAMVEEAESLVSQIAQGFESSKDTVISAIQELGNQVVTLTQNITDKTSDILGIYDDTLSSVAESGNELFDLRDTAKEAFSTAAKAVAEFEKSNKLSGKSSAVLRGEIVSVQSQLNSLLSAGNLDFSGFAQFTELSARQGALKRELNSVVAVEAEYQDLLDKRGTTQEDLIFIEATIASLNDQLIDTRIKESEIITKAKDASVAFTRSQEDLKDITELLAESNFNLNQVRVNEESAVNKMRTALQEFTTDTASLTELLDGIGGTSGAALRESFIQAATGNAEIMFANLGDIARSAEINAAVAQATTAFDSLEQLVAEVSSYFNPVATEFEAVNTSAGALTDRFVTFNEDLVKYLDQEGLAKFYGEGGVFSSFRDSLLTTLKTDGFDILTASGGPLESFNLNLNTIGQAMTNLTTSGNFLDVTIQTIQTSFGNLVTAMGTDMAGLSAAYVGLSVFSASAQQVGDIDLTAMVDNLGEINLALDYLGNLRISVDAFDSLSSIYTSISVVDSLLNSISFDVSTTNATTAISTAVSIIDSTLNSINLSPVTDTTVDKINVAFTAINSTLGSVDLVPVTDSTVGKIDVAFTAINSTLSNVNLVPVTDSTVDKIDITFSAIDSALNNVNLVTARDSSVDQINLVNTNINSSLTGVNFVDTRDSSVTQINLVNTNLNSALSEVNYVTNRDGVVSQISLVNTNINSALSDINYVTNTDSAVGQINLVNNNINSALTGIDFITSASGATEQITLVSNNLNSILQSLNFISNSETVVDEINLVNTNINSALSGVNFVTNRDSSVDQINTVNTNINSALNGVNFVTTRDSSVSQINSVTTSLNSALNGVNFVVTTNSVVDKIAVYNTAVNSALSNVDLVANTNSLVNRIGTVSVLVNTALSNVDFEDTTADVVQMIKDYNTDVNKILGNQELTVATDTLVDSLNKLKGLETAVNAIDFTTAITDVTSSLTSVNSVVNQYLDAIDVSAKLKEATDQIGLVNTNINLKLDAVDFTTRLREATDQVSDVNTAINNRLSTITFASNLATATNSIGSVATSINTALSNSSIISMQNTFTGLINVFNTGAKNAVESFKESIDKFANLTTQINSVAGLAQEINDLSASNGDISRLITRFNELQTQITALTGTTGIASVKAQLATIATDLGAAWSRVNLQVSQLPTQITVANTNNVTVQGGFNSTDSANLNRLATTFPAITGATYSRKTYAKGGYVDGMGTSTSDSIPASLSNGEYVIKAASVDKLGIDALNYLNNTGDVSSLVASMGRRGDTELAHINQFEKDMLKKLRNEVSTTNPKTGLEEFFPLWSGAVGKLFAKEEKALLGKTYLPAVLKTNENVNNYSSTAQERTRPEKRKFTSSSDSTPWTNPTFVQSAMSGSSAGGVQPFNDQVSENALYTPTYTTAQINSQRAMFNMMNEMLVARKPGIALKNLEWMYAPNKQDDNKKWATTYLLNKSTTDNSSVQTGYGMYRHFRWAGFNSGNKNYGPYEGGWEQKSAAALKQHTKDYFGKDLPLPLAAEGASQYATQAMIDQAIDLANQDYGNFGDLYMLGNTGKGRPTAANLASGGLIDSSYKQFKGLRDSVSAMLEPGEFVLRKPIVDKLGVDTLNKINAGSGDISGDVNVEVNINNNGTPANVTATPEIRRENGKIIVDVILEDIRTNGPIRQQIRSLR